MTVIYNRIDADTVEQITTFDPIKTEFKQSEIQIAIDDTQTELDNMPAVKPYPINATIAEKNAIDKWNIKNSNKFTKENLQESIDGQTRFLDMIKAVKAVK